MSGGRVSGFDVFLSYARHDRSTARMFADCLVEEGFTVWWDASLRSGETFDEVIERNLRDARAVIVLWSPASVASRWVRAEATLADRRNKLAPAIIEACDRPIIFELTHAAELSDWKGDITDPRWRHFVSDLNRLMERGTEQDDQSPARPKPAPAATNFEDVPSRRQAGPQSLRPGSDEVIFANRVRRDDPVQAPTPTELRAAPPPPPAPSAAPSPSEVHCLEVKEGDFAGKLIMVDPAGLKIGRTPPADAVIPHRSVSREHCIVGIANDELLVTDLNSTNGTSVDGVRIRRATVLPVGSILKVGQIALTHAIHDRAEAEQRRGISQSGAPNDLPAGRLAATS
ncbi:MAG: TIR domain-containing protein [Sphingomicrobium sp.]